MPQPFKDAVTLCKTILRNGFDAYVINTRLQEQLFTDSGEMELDIATDMNFDELIRHFPQVQPSNEAYVTGTFSESGTCFRFYPANVIESSHPETTVSRVTARMLDRMNDADKVPMNLACPYIARATDLYEGFLDFSTGLVQLEGLPDETLKRNYLLGIRAMRFAANYQLMIEPNSWMAIVRGAKRLLDYVSVTDIMDEWRKVEAENLCNFVRMLFDAQILHGLIPEVAALTRVMQLKNDAAEMQNVFDHTLEVMRRYPEELPYDWYGVLACLFHDVGKLYSAEYFDESWHFYQHNHVGAKVTRKILNGLRFPQEEVDLICHLVRHHMRFHFMLTDKGIRRFRALDEYPRLIEMVRADLKARDGNYASFNHNMKKLERADTPEMMYEPLLNGNEIMEFAGLKPGPTVGLIRDALLQAQIIGDVTNVPEAVEFVSRHKDRERL